MSEELEWEWGVSTPKVTNVSWSFAGKTVFITGAARSQGRAHAIAFAEAGAELALLDVCAESPIVPWGRSTEHDLRSVAGECEALGAKVITFVADIRDSGQVKAAVDDTAQQFGKIDILVNNAAIYPFAPVDMDEEFWDEVLDTNLKGAFLCSKHVSRYMRRARAGKIVSTGSSATVLSLGHQTSYAASKHGLLGFTKALAIDLAPYGINVNVVSPGSVHTPHAMAYFESYVKDLAAARTDDDPPLAFENVIDVGGRWNLFNDEVLHPRDISNAVMFLASDAARYITGQNLLVDQGFSLK
jgi:NAD(P)-dependent dehydrogenase (short-subunit alcohol dehydrogenase family)